MQVQATVIHPSTLVVPTRTQSQAMIKKILYFSFSVLTDITGKEIRRFSFEFEVHKNLFNT